MCFATFRRACHWGPITALGIIKIVTGMTVHCSSMWWPPHESFGGFVNTSCFIALSGLTLYNFLSAMFHGPGHLPLEWKPVYLKENEEDKKYLQFCTICEGYKAPRAHHCRKCEKCVKKMDHHCPWVNNCVGWGNHCHFAAFLSFAVLGCGHASVILACSLYRGLNRPWYIYYSVQNVPIVHLNIYTLVLTVFALGLAVGVVLAVGMLLVFQIRGIVRNRTGVEDWIVEKAVHRRVGTDKKFMFPYDLGFRENIKQVFTFSGQPIGDGVQWKVAEGFDQYSLTREQLEQKNEKRQRTRMYRITKAVSGSWFPCNKGAGVFFNPPCTDEPRIKLKPGDQINVTRWRKYWLFGDKTNKDEVSNGKPVKVRGWFPRNSAVEICGDGDTSHNDETNKKTD